MQIKDIVVMRKLQGALARTSRYFRANSEMSGENPGATLSVPKQTWGASYVGIHC